VNQRIEIDFVADEIGRDGRLSGERSDFVGAISDRETDHARLGRRDEDVPLAPLPRHDGAGGAEHADEFPFLDGQRACALGASYGGFLINWIAGQTDRFRCLVSHDGNLDERFAYFATEELWFPEWEHRGTPWENPQGYSRHNPIEHVSKWKTPMLVVHGGLDYRVVDTEGLAVFNVLQRRGIPSKLLYFPDENHWVLKPQNSILWHDTVMSWLAQWLR